MYILFFYVEWKICLENIQSTFSISISIAYLYIYIYTYIYTHIYKEVSYISPTDNFYET